jgi:hypothetical protein
MTVEQLKKVSIIVCNNCGQPLIFTFAFAYAEYFCMNEFTWGGMFGTGHKVEATPRLLATKKLYNRRWGQIKKHLVMTRFYRKDCIKCDSGARVSHDLHLTDDEKAKAAWALNKLKEYAGVV